MLNPPHPGEFIRTEIIEPLGLSITGAAEILGVSRPALSSLLNGKADLSGEMALRIEKAFAPGWTRSCECSLPMTLPARVSARARFAFGAIAPLRPCWSLSESEKTA